MHRENHQKWPVMICDSKCSSPALMWAIFRLDSTLIWNVLETVSNGLNRFPFIEYNNYLRAMTHDYTKLKSIKLMKGKQELIVGNGKELSNRIVEKSLDELTVLPIASQPNLLISIIPHYARYYVAARLLLVISSGIFSRYMPVKIWTVTIA